MMSGYWQVEMDPADKQKTAFVCQEGLFQFNLMRLTNTPSTFERLMETVLAGLQYNICLVFLDDIIVYGSSFEEEISRLKQVFTRLSWTEAEAKELCPVPEEGYLFGTHRLGCRSIFGSIKGRSH